eukprot:COSAG02_NODE_28573_length_587_cov_0.737705_1_plen_90_part_00
MPSLRLLCFECSPHHIGERIGAGAIRDLGVENARKPPLLELLDPRQLATDIELHAGEVSLCEVGDRVDSLECHALIAEEARQARLQLGD